MLCVLLGGGTDCCWCWYCCCWYLIGWWWKCSICEEEQVNSINGFPYSQSVEKEELSFNLIPKSSISFHYRDGLCFYFFYIRLVIPSTYYCNLHHISSHKTERKNTRGSDLLFPFSCVMRSRQGNNQKRMEIVIKHMLRRSRHESNRSLSYLVIICRNIRDGSFEGVRAAAVRHLHRWRGGLLDLVVESVPVHAMRRLLVVNYFLACNWRKRWRRILDGHALHLYLLLLWPFRGMAAQLIQLALLWLSDVILRERECNWMSERTIPLRATELQLQLWRINFNRTEAPPLRRWGRRFITYHRHHHLPRRRLQNTGWSANISFLAEGK